MKQSHAVKALFAALIPFCLISCQGRVPDELPSLASFDFEGGASKGWQPNVSEQWKVTDQEGSKVYELLSAGNRSKFRAPTSWSLISDQDVTSFTVTGRLKSNADTANPHRDLCLFFHYQDPTHFYFVHLSASSDESHNIIGLVNEADRIKVNVEPAGESIYRLTDTQWHNFKVTCDAGTGLIQAFIDDMSAPILTTRDRTLTHGLVGIGSYDDTGYFDDIKLWGQKTTAK